MAYAQLKRQLRQSDVKAGANSKGTLGEHARIGDQSGVLVSNSIMQAGQQGGFIQRSADRDEPDTLGQAGGTLDAGSEASGLMGASASQRIDQNVSSMIGRRFGADFSDVRIHTDKFAQRVADGMNARAFTHGKDIYFNEGEYDPGSSSGQRLLAHELTHTIQQGQVSQQGGSPSENQGNGQYGGEDPAMAYAQTTRKGQNSNLNTAQSAQTAGGGTPQTASNSVMQAKLKVGGSSTPAEAEADRVASQVMQGGTLQGGIPVTQSVSGGTVQRDFLGFKKRFQKAVDERNENYDEYKNLSRWERFKWAAANPLAWAFGRSKANQQNTYKRAVHRKMVEDIAFNDFGNTKKGNRKRERLKSKMADQDAAAMSEQGNGAQGGVSAGDVAEAGLTASDYIQTGLENIGGNIAEFVGNDTSQNGVGVGSNALAAVNDAASFKENVESAAEYIEAGDNLSAGIKMGNAVSDGTSVVGDVASTVGNIASLAGGEIPFIDQVTPGLSLAASAIKMGTAGAEMVRAGKTRSRTTAGMESSEEKIQRLQARLDQETDEGKKSKLKRRIKRAEAQKTLYSRGHNTAVIDQTEAGADMAVAGLKTAANIAELSGAGSAAGVALNVTSTVLDKVKGWLFGRKRKNTRKEEVQKELGMTDDRIAEIQEQYKQRGYNLSKGDVKKIMLLRSGSRGYEEAYMKSTQKLKKSAGKRGMGEVAKALGVGNADSEAGEALIDKRLGVSEEYAGKLDEGIKKERANKIKKLAPSWRR